MTHPAPVIPLTAAHALSERDPHVLVARYRKARRCANALLANGADVTSTEQLGQSELGRKLTAQVAHCNTPSETTWALVVELVREVKP